MRNTSTRRLAFWGIQEHRDLHQIIRDQDERTLRRVLYLTAPYRRDCNAFKDITTEDGKIWRRVTPLHLAVRDNEPGLVKLLLENGADINIRDAKGKNSIMCFDVQLFDADMYATTKCNWDASILVRDNGVKVLDLLFEHGAKEEDFINTFGEDRWQEYKSLSNRSEFAANFVAGFYNFN